MGKIICDYCGTYEKIHNRGDIPHGWVQVRKGLYNSLEFCSRKCKDDAGE